MREKDQKAPATFTATVSRVVTSEMLYLRRELTDAPARRYVLLADQASGVRRSFHDIPVGSEFRVTVDSESHGVIVEATLTRSGKAQAPKMTNGVLQSDTTGQTRTPRGKVHAGG